jgi:hypothetical protein
MISSTGSENCRRLSAACWALAVAKIFFEPHVGVQIDSRCPDGLMSEPPVKVPRKIIVSGIAMVTKITFDVLDGYLHCKYKGYLRLAERTGIKSEYESTFVELRNELRVKAIEKIRSHFHQHIPNGIVLTRSTLIEGAPFVLDVELQDDQFSVHCDGLKRVAGRSELGNFHYVPVLFCAHRRIRKMHRTLLEVLGFLLSRV